MLTVGLIYTWGDVIYPADQLKAWLDAGAFTHLCIVGDMSTKGMLGTVANLPAGLPFVLQPSPVCVTAATQVPTWYPQHMAALKALAKSNPNFVGFVGTHEDGSLAPGVDLYAAKLSGWCLALGIEPIFMSGNASQDALADKCGGSLWAEFVVGGLNDPAQGGAADGTGWPDAVFADALAKQKLRLTGRKIPGPMDCLQAQMSWSQKFDPKVIGWYGCPVTKARWKQVLTLTQGFGLVTFQLASGDNFWTLSDKPDFMAGLWWMRS